MARAACVRRAVSTTRRRTSLARSRHFKTKMAIWICAVGSPTPPRLPRRACWWLARTLVSRVGGGRGSTQDSHYARATRFEYIDSSTVEPEVTSVDPFPVRRALTELRISPVVTSLTRHADRGDLHTLTFTLTRDQLVSVSSDHQATPRHCARMDGGPGGPCGFAVDRFIDQFDWLRPATADQFRLRDRIRRCQLIVHGEQGTESVVRPDAKR